MLLVMLNFCFFGFSGPPAKENQAESETESDSSSAVTGNKPKSEKSDGTSKKERKIKSVPKLRRSLKSTTNQNLAQKTDDVTRSFSFLRLIKCNCLLNPQKNNSTCI